VRWIASLEARAGRIGGIARRGRPDFPGWRGKNRQNRRLRHAIAGVRPFLPMTDDE